jgi:hypothetical protein
MASYPPTNAARSAGTCNSSDTRGAHCSFKDGRHACQGLRSQERGGGRVMMMIDEHLEHRKEQRRGGGGSDGPVTMMTLEGN